MRHRFHSICPYFAMFPETFVEEHLGASRFDGVVFDPFAGRGTTVFESLVRGRNAAGCDVHPVAVCVSGAKSDPPARSDVIHRLDQLEEDSRNFNAQCEDGELKDFFALCFDGTTRHQVQFLRDSLRWREDRTDRFIAALCLGALHGESHRTRNCFSNRMPRTISTKPAYSVRWWRRHGYMLPPTRDVFEILRYWTAYRFKSTPPDRRGEVVLADARNAARVFPHIAGMVSDVITSPPYLDTTNYREDQWLRLWFLGNDPVVDYSNHDGRHVSASRYWTFLTEAWAGVAPLLAPQARLVVRIGGRHLDKDEIACSLTKSLQDGMKRNVTPTGDASSEVRQSQATAFRGARPTSMVEHDFVFSLE